MTELSPIELTIDFRTSNTSEEQQEKLTQSLWQQMRDMEGVRVARVPDPNPPEGSRTIASFLWGLLKAEISLSCFHNVLAFLGDRLSNRPIKIKAKLPDGREFEIEASSREELLAAEETIARLAQSTK